MPEVNDEKFYIYFSQGSWVKSDDYCTITEIADDGFCYMAEDHIWIAGDDTFDSAASAQVECDVRNA